MQTQTQGQANTGTNNSRGDREVVKRSAAISPTSREYADVRNRFTYHPPTDEQVKKYEQLRLNAGNLAMLISDYCPPGREKQLALTQLEQSVMWANASIAREQELNYRDEVTRLDGADHYTATRFFVDLGQSVQVDVPANQLGLPVGQGLGIEQINQRVLALAKPALDQSTTDLKAYLVDHPGMVGELESKLSSGAIAGSIDSPAGLGARTGIAGENEKIVDSEAPITSKR
jgi:hypothetical protein